MEQKRIVIVYPNMRYDIESAFEIVSLWKCDEIAIYAIEDFDRDYGRDEYKPYGMPHGLEKVQLVIREKLRLLGAVIDPDEVVIDESSSSDDESGYDADCWIIKFSITESVKEKKKKKDKEELRTTKFTLTYFYDIDAFGDEWPEMEPVDVLIHTNGPLDPEVVADSVENPYDVDIYATREMLQEVWCAIGSEIEPIDDNSDLCFYGNLGDYMAGVEGSSTED